jgi:hypothetical protein
VSFAAPSSPGEEILQGLLLRRVPPDNACFPNGIGTQPSNSAYRTKQEDEGISAFLAEMTRQQEALAGHPGFALIAITAENVTALGFRVVYDPPPPGHVLIKGDFTKAKRRLLCARSVVVEPGNPEVWRSHVERG